MAFLKWGSNIKARKFDYVPRYYDPEKEEKELRIKRLRNEALPTDTEMAQSRIRAGFRQKYRPQNRNIEGQKNRLIRLVAIIATLIFISYYILSSKMAWLENFLG